ncbi:ATP-binding protein [Lysobacter sp. HA18]
MKNLAFFRFPGAVHMRMSNASDAAGGLARAPLPLLWLATIAAPLTAYALASMASADGLLRDAVTALFLVGIALIGTSGSAVHALVAALLSFVMYRVKMSHDPLAMPLFSSNDVVVLAAFVGSAGLVAWIAAGQRRLVKSLTVRQAHGSIRRELAERLAEAPDESGVVRAALSFVETSLRRRAVLWLGERAFYSGDATDVPRPPALADGHVQQGDWLWIPLNGVDSRLGAVGVQRGPHHTAAEEELALSLSSDIAHSVVRARLTGELQQERVANESERLCTALLASVSHDLRTPLTTIMGAAESLRSFGASLDSDDRSELLSTIEVEGRRLDRYIQNLVDVTRIGDGQLSMDVEATTMDELIASAAARLRRYDPDVKLDVRIDANVPPIRVHAALIEQAIFNVLHNASKFSPDGDAVAVRASVDESESVVIDVLDVGPGIPHAERERVFDMFYSADRGDPARAGTGLGLAISQSIVRAHGGEVSAHAGRDGAGTRMRLVLPVAPVGCEPCT